MHTASDVAIPRHLSRQLFKLIEAISLLREEKRRLLRKRMGKKNLLMQSSWQVAVLNIDGLVPRFSRELEWPWCAVAAGKVALAYVIHTQVNLTHDNNDY